MSQLFWVGLGGAIGAVCRYLISQIPWKGTFPVLTLVTNLAGALLIGFVVGMAERKETVSRELILFLKTGVCGGFTTFSTFSLESLQLLEKGEKLYAACYIFLSVAGCIAGVWAGRHLAKEG